MKPALAQICSLHSPFETDIEEYASSNCRAVELWITKLEQYVEQHSLEQTQELLREHEIEVPVASLQGGLLASQGEARQQAWELFRRRLDLIGTLGGQTIVIACDVHPPLQQQDIQRVQASLVEVAQTVGPLGLRAALEFQSDAAFGNNLQTAAALVEEVGSPHLGLCFDLFHYAIGPSKPEDLGYLTSDSLFHVQVCDLADVPREFARDSDRILPGDGDLVWDPIRQRLRDIDYQGFVSVEVMNPQIWSVPPRQFSEIALSALEQFLA